MDETEPRPPKWAAELVTEGEWAGWKRRVRGDTFEGVNGPFYWRTDEPAGLRMAFRAEPRHMNGGGFMHGGCIMTFADFALFAIAHAAIPGLRGVTATLNGEFIAAVSQGTVLEARGEVVKAGRSLVFLRGLVSAAGEPVMTFSGVIKRVRP
jgi:uncharacterized protein (TIGR00369 family)